MVSASAGLALEGFRVWVYTITPFLIERAYEQVKLDIDQQNVNVKLVGFSNYPTLGPTHSVLNEDIWFNLFNNIVVHKPGSEMEVLRVLEDESVRVGPCLILLS